VAGLLLAGAVALILEMGISSSITAPVASWLDANFAIYRGMRDAGKWAVLLAFVYSQLVGLGSATIIAAFRRAPDPNAGEWVRGVAIGVLVALPLYYGNGLLFGAHGEIRPSQYPAGWYAADRVLAADTHPGRTLFLPWHEYMSYSFVHNQNRVVAPPAPSFFSVPIVVSSDPEVPGIMPPRSADQDAVTALVRAGSSGQWAEGLNTYRIKYVLLAKELDWTYFTFLDDQAGLSKVGDFGPIILYRNDLVFQSRGSQAGLGSGEQKVKAGKQLALIPCLTGPPGGCSNIRASLFDGGVTCGWPQKGWPAKADLDLGAST
jgi:hypothetical protein